MAQYDGSIRINTEIEYRNAKKELKNLESSISKTADEIASLRSKMDALKDVEIPTQEYKELEKEAERLAGRLGTLTERQEKFLSTGGSKESTTYKRMDYDVENLKASLNEAISEMERLKISGKAFTLGSNTDEYAQMSAQMEQLSQKMQSDTERQAELQSALAAEEQRLLQIRENAVAGNQRIVEVVERRKQLLAEIADMERAGVGAGYQQYDLAKQQLASFDQEIRDYNNGIEEVKENYRKLGDTAKRALSKINSMLGSTGTVIRKFDSLLKNAFSGLNKSTRSTNKSLSSMGISFKNILKYGFGIRSLYALFNKLRSAIKEGYTNLYNDNERFKKSVDSLKASLTTLKNSFAAAFRPLVDIAIPYIQKVIDYMSGLLDSVGQFLAAITGQKMYTKAIRQTTAALKEEKKAAEGYLNPLDEINKYQTSKDSKADVGGGGQMFQELPISDRFKEIAEKVKDIFSKIFAPLKEAWNREGKFVIDSWKYALREVWDLIKSIGADFLEVWQQEKTVKVFEDILHIIGDIGLAIGSIANNFRLAWEEGETGKRILEGIRDIVGVVVANIRYAADVTAEWARELDFSPLLTKVQGLVESLVPVFDSLSGIVTDFYEKVLLPLGKWTLEKGLPDLLQVFIDFNNKVDWEALRSRLAQFWEHLEPFAETVGEGLIIFIERCANALANFINSPAFENFLTTIEDWMDKVKPEDVADALGKLATAIIGIKGAIMAFSAISSVLPVFKSLASVLGLFGPTGIAVGALALASFLSKTIKDVDMKKVGQAVSNGLNKLIDFIGSALSEIDWYTLGQKVIDFISGIDWGQLFTTLVENLVGILGNVIGGTVALVAVIAQALGKLIADGATETPKYFLDKIEECGGNVVQGILKGITDAFAGIGNWIVEHIFQPFIDGFKNAFGIHSPSTVMQEMGTYIMEGLLGGITSLVGDVKETWESMKETAVEIWNKTSESFNKTMDDLKSRATSKLNDIGSSWKSAWDGMRSAVTSIISSVKSAISEFFSWISSKVDDIKESLSSLGKTSSLKSTAGSKFLSGSFSSSNKYLRSASYMSIPDVPIPKLATGAVIPANREFLAVLGDQKHGTNIEAPLDTLMQANEQLLLKTLSQLGLTGNVGNSNPQTIIIKQYLDRKQVAEAVVKEGKVQQMSTGSNMFMLGTT